MRSKLKQGKVIAGIVAIAIVAVVLVLTIPPADNGAPDNDVVPAKNVVATVNGEEIMQEDVAEMQELYAAQDMPISEEQALEQLITQKLVYQKVEREDYLPTDEEVEAQVATWGMTMEDFHEALEEQGVSYEDFRVQMAVENYLDDAVEVPEVTEEEAREFYEDWKQQLPEEEEPQPFEDVKSDIVIHLQQQKQQEAMVVFIDELLDELRAKADIEYAADLNNNA